MFGSKGGDKMTHPKVVDQIRKYFDYLFDANGFEVISETYFQSFGNWVVVLQSDDCRIRFLQDRGEVSIAVGPVWSPPSWNAGPWFDLSIVIAFLTPKKEILERRLGNTDQQIEYLADTFRTYCDQICELFREDTFRQERDKLELLRDQSEEQYWGRLTKKT
jgi:hypothetical protein